MRNDAPLFEWEQKEPPFETLRACEEYKDAPVGPVDKGLIDWSAAQLAARGNVPEEDSKKAFERNVLFSRCIPSDDPRLKEK